MKRKLQLTAAMSLAAALSLLLSGCAGLRFGVPVEELYSLPRLPGEYEDLRAGITEILEGGAEYAAPTSGTNIQPVQLVDLNGDGVEEALAFMRKTMEEKPLKIYIFSARDGGYEQSAVIEGSGSAIFSVVYSDLDGNGETEMAVGWKATSEIQALSVYTLQDGQPEELLRTTYVKYSLTDLDGDGRQEMITFRADSEGMGIAEMHTWQDGGLTLRSSSKISATMAELSNLGRVSAGTLQDGSPALFVTGVEDSTVVVTDILTMQKGELTNIVLSDITGASTEVEHYLSLYPTDINGDGVTEVPAPVLLSGSGGPHFRVEWMSYDITGNSARVQSTYHDVEDGWYLVLPEAWRDEVEVARTTGSDEAVVTFYSRDGDELKEFLKIITITGDSREIKAVRGGRFILSRQIETIYSAELPQNDETWEYALVEDELRSSFNLIMTEWLAGDN